MIKDVSRIKKIYLISLALYLFVLPVNTGLAGFLSGISIANYFAAICIVTGFLQIDSSRVKEFPKLGIPLVLFYSFSIISLLWSEITSGIWFVSTFAMNFLVVLSGICVCFDRHDCEILEKSVLFGLVLAVLAVILNFGYLLREGRLFMDFPRNVDPNYFSCDLYPILVLSFCSFFVCKSRRWVYICILAIGLVIIFLASSRGAMLGIACMVVAFFVLNIKKYKKFVLCFIPIALLLVVLLLFVSGKSDSRLLQRFSLSTILSGGGTGRIAIWRDAISVFRSSDIIHCLFGYGLGSFKGVVNSVGIYGVNYSHNMLVQTLIEGGIVGTVLLISMFVCMFLFSRKSGNDYPSILIVGVFVAALTLDIESTRLLGVTLLLPFVYNCVSSGQHGRTAEGGL